MWQALNATRPIDAPLGPCSPKKSGPLQPPASVTKLQNLPVMHVAAWRCGMTGDDETRTQSWLEIELADDMDEELEQSVDAARFPLALRTLLEKHRKSTLDRHTYFKELLRLQGELVRLQDWVRHAGLKMVVLFEGRD